MNIDNVRRSIMEYMNGRFTFDDVHKQILDRSAPFSRAQRKYVLSLYAKGGEFQEFGRIPKPKTEE